MDKMTENMARDIRWYILAKRKFLKCMEELKIAMHPANTWDAQRIDGIAQVLAQAARDMNFAERDYIVEYEIYNGGSLLRTFDDVAEEKYRSMDEQEG